MRKVAGCQRETRSQSAVLPSMSVKRKVTVPEGRSGMIHSDARLDMVHADCRMGEDRSEAERRTIL